MSRLAKLFAANAIAAAGLCSAAVALSPIAAAEPVLPPVMPDVPALGMIQQLQSHWRRTVLLNETFRSHSFDCRS